MSGRSLLVRFINGAIAILARAEVEELSHLAGLSYKDLVFQDGDSAGGSDSSMIAKAILCAGRQESFHQGRSGTFSKRQKDCETEPGQ